VRAQPGAPVFWRFREHRKIVTLCPPFYPIHPGIGKLE
jgi:hypothetical protein